jgi:hypothetical protein
MSYYERQYQLNKTLLSYTKSSFKDFSVIIVDDASPTDIILPELPFKVEVIKLENKTWLSQVVPFNIGFHRALEYKPSIILITEPECYHVGDVLSYASRVNNKKYISFGCFKINEEMTFGECDIHDLVEKNNVIITQDETGDWDQTVNAWGNHPTIDPVAFHYCCAITTENLIKLNGFDERLAFGVSFEDDYIVRQIKNLGLEIEITVNPFVVHQWHERLNHNIMQRAPQMWDKNYRVLMNELIPDKTYRARHILTRDLNVEN